MPPRLTFLCCLALLGACQEAPEVTPAPDRAPRAAAVPGVVARAGEEPILLADIEQPVAMQLHDLELRQFRLLRSSLTATLLARFEQSGDARRVAELMLEPPRAPRYEVTADPGRTRPPDDGPVTIVAFCNFQSPHCARLQVTLSHVLPLFPAVVRYGHRDLPTAFHRQASAAAQAAGCALEQGAYWRYHDVLYADPGSLDRERLVRAARSASLDPAAFEACLDSGRHAATVAADSGLAAGLGVVAVPAVFVNGLYAGAEIDAPYLVWLIEQELARLDVASPRQAPSEAPSAAGYRLRALFPSTHAGQGLALLAGPDGTDDPRMVREGLALSHGIVVRRITTEAVELVHDGRLERLDFATAQSTRAPVTGSPADSEMHAAATPHRAVPVWLDRDEVLLRLADRSGLAEVLEPVPMTAGDYRQLRIAEVRPGSLYELLGLQAGDVVLGVNEQPVHEADNPLWRALEAEDEVRLRVMRTGGLARHYTYRFDD